MKVSDERINLWARAVSESEEERCQNAISQVADVIRDHFGLSVSTVRQGSYRNRTNTRADSDVDIAVVHGDYYFPGTEILSDSDKTQYLLILFFCTFPRIQAIPDPDRDCYFSDSP